MRCCHSILLVISAAGFAEIPLPGAAPPQRQSVQASAAPAVSTPAVSSPQKSLSPPAGTSAGGRTPSPGRPAAAAPPPQTKRESILSGCATSFLSS